jgi:hypothetical protein
MKRLPLFITLTLSGCFILVALSVAAQTDRKKGPAKEDAVFELQHVSLYINHAPVAESIGTCGGTVIWFYLPDKGQFIFSSNPHEGFEFQKIGTVRGNLISFWHNENLYEMISTSPIVTDGGEADLWMMHDASSRPKGCDTICIGGASPFEYFMKSR